MIEIKAVEKTTYKVTRQGYRIGSILYPGIHPDKRFHAILGDTSEPVQSVGYYPSVYRAALAIEWVFFCRQKKGC